MRASLRNIQMIEAYLSNQLSSPDQDRFKQRLLLEPALFDQVQQQKHTYHIIQHRGRQQILQELDRLHSDLFSSKNNQTWQRRILAFFERY